jgi:hypothetical protein
MEQSTSKVVLIVDRFYRIISNSFYYWLQLLRKGVIYGWNPALRKTLAHRELQESGFSNLEGNGALPLEKGLSFVFSLSGSLLWICLLQVESKGALALFGLTFSSTFLLVTFILGNYYLLELKKQDTLQPALAFYKGIKAIWQQPAFTCFLLAGFLLLFVGFCLNKILFVSFLPGLYIELLYHGEHKMRNERKS